MATKTLSQKLESARLLIFNSRDPEIAPRLEEIGVDNSYIQNGQTLYEETMHLVDQQKTEYQEQYLAYDNFYLERDMVEDYYRLTYKLVRVFSRHDENLQDRLQLDDGNGFPIAKWIEHVISFYNLLQNEQEFLSKLAQFKLTPARLTAEKEAVVNLKNLRNNAIAEKGQAQEATRLRNDKLDELDNYCRDLKVLAEIALTEKPQLMEKLGILVRVS